VEDPVEYRIPLANQQQVQNKAGVTFKTLLKSSVRQDPDILFIGEIRDPFCAKIAMDFASTGHLTFSTLHTSNATTAIFRLERLEISRGTMADSILAIVALIKMGESPFDLTNGFGGMDSRFRGRDRSLEFFRSRLVQRTT
jgi:type II secretory ATPase GspE/PulE/Tfp pilus assembly ATPase PilB-like protein